MELLDWFFPRECIRCGKEGEWLCFECKKSLQPHPELCPSCHKASIQGRVCKACNVDGRRALEGIVIGFSYQQWLKKLILKLKFYHKKDVGQFLAQRLALLVQLHNVFSEAKEAGKLILTFVPSHRYRHYFQKGYNQSQLLARSLAKEIGTSFQQLVSKHKSTKSQLQLKRAERLQNLKNAFMIKDLEAVPRGAVILIVDDVVTTGASLNEVAKVIKFSRPDLKIWGLAVARHMG